MASSDNHCQIVVPEMLATKPRLMTSARMSGTCSRDRGKPSWEGSSQALALTATTSSGENSAPASAIALFESFEAFLEEALAPFADDLATGVQALGDLVVAETLGGEEEEAGSKNIAIR